MALYKWSTLLAGIWTPDIPEWMVYLTQQEYDALSEDEKMDWTSYGIIEDGNNALTSDMINSIYWVLTWIWKTTTSLSTGGSWRFPANTNIIHVQWYITSWWYWSWTVSLFFTKWLPTNQYVWYWAYSSSYSGYMRFSVDRANLTISASSQSWAYPTISVTVTAF